MLRSRILAAIAIVAMFAPFLSTGVGAQSLAPVTQSFTFASASSPPSPSLTLGGRNACTVVVASGPTGMVLQPQASTDGGNNWLPDTGISSGSITTTGVSSGNLNTVAPTNFRLAITALGGGGPVVGTISCGVSASAGAGSGGGTAGTTSVTNFPAVQAITAATALPVTGNFPTPIPFPATQSVAIMSSVPVLSGALPSTNVSLSTACSTPLTPTSCAATSYALFDTSSGGADYSYQINATNGGTFGFYTSNDGTNFSSSNASVPGAPIGQVALASSTTVAGKFVLIGGTSRYVAIVATVAPTSAVTVIPYLGTHTAAIAIHALPPIVQNDMVVQGTITATDAVVAAPSGNGQTLSGASTAGSYVAMANPGGQSGWQVGIQGTAGTPLYFEDSADSTNGVNGNWITVNGRQTGLTGGSVIGPSTTLANVVYRGNTSGSAWFRVRAAGTLVGTPAITIRMSQGTGAVFLNSSIPGGSNLIGSATVIPSPGAVFPISGAPTPIPTPAGGVYPISGAPTPIPTAVPTGGGAPAYVVNLGAPAPYVPNSVNPLGTPAPQNLDAQGNELVTLNAPNNSGTAAPLKTTNAITGGAGSTLGLLGVGLCSGATSAPYCAAVNSNSQLAVSNPYAGTVNQALQVSSFQGFGCVSSALPGTLVTADFQPCFSDLSGNMYVTTTPSNTNGGSGTITALNGAVVVPTYGYGSVGVTISNTFVGTVAFQASTDGGQTYPWTITMASTGTSTASTATAVGSFKGNVAGYDHFRVYDTAFTSGTVTVNYSLGTTPYVATITGYGTQYTSICATNTSTCVNPGTLSQTGNGLGAALPVQSNNLLSNGSSEDLFKSTTAYSAPSTQTGVAAVGGICNSSVAVNAIAAATQLVALSSGKYVYVCGFTLSATTSSGAATVQFEYGTGTTCGTGTTVLSGAMSVLASTPLVAQNPNPQFNSAVSNSLCIVPGGTGVSLSGYVTYGLI